MQTDTISVPEIHCDHCKQSIEGALTPVEGVANAVVDIPNATVEVHYEEDAITREQIVKVIEDQGYEVA